VDTELIAYFADCKNYSENSGLKFWVTNANKYPLLAPLAQCTFCQLPHLRHIGLTCALSLWTADSRQEKSAD